jgi:hypothetical protein
MADLLAPLVPMLALVARWHAAVFVRFADRERLNRRPVPRGVFVATASIAHTLGAAMLFAR